DAYDSLMSQRGGSVMVSERGVMAPVRHRSLPTTVEPVSTEFDAPASTLPWKLTFEPSVEDAKMAQNTLRALAPLISSTRALLLTVSEDPIWKIQTALASPCPSSVTVPPTAMLIVDA